MKYHFDKLYSAARFALAELAGVPEQDKSKTKLDLVQALQWWEDDYIAFGIWTKYDVDSWFEHIQPDAESLTKDEYQVFTDYLEGCLNDGEAVSYFLTLATDEVMKNRSKEK